MSFYTSLTGVNAATAMLGVTSNNIANVGTTGFKRSRADFGDIFATSPLQKASSTVGQGVSLKQVSQEFGQGNIAFSANALDLAITGDGFFPLRSADGLSSTYTRNGSFMLNEQYNVVNSAGQRLMAATVDSTGSANVNERVVLTIPQKTSGEAKQTTQVQLGLNFPADASLITVPFNRTDPTSFNKSTAFTVYDKGGNGYLATIYYSKTRNASQTSPYNKWQTHVFVGADQVAASLVQSTDAGGDTQYVNQYGQIKSYKDVKDELTTAKTQLISLNELTDKRISVPASVAGASVSGVDLSGGTSFAGFAAKNPSTVISGHTATTLNAIALGDITINGRAIGGTVDVSGIANSGITAGSNAVSQGDNVAAAINLQTISTGVIATNNAGAVTLANVDGTAITTVIGTSALSANSGLGFTVASSAGTVSTVSSVSTVLAGVAPTTFNAIAAGVININGTAIGAVASGSNNPNVIKGNAPSVFTGIASGDISITVGNTTYNIGAITAGTNAITQGTNVAAAINAVTNLNSNANGVTASVDAATGAVTLTSNTALAAITTTIGASALTPSSGLGSAIAATAGTVTTTLTAAAAQGQNVAAAINLKTASTGVVATTNALGAVTLNHVTGDSITAMIGGTLTGLSANSGLSATIAATVGTVSSSQLSSTLNNLFAVRVDGSANYEWIDLSSMTNSTTPMNGVTLAAEVTKQLNRKFGDETNYDFTDPTSRTFAIGSTNNKDSAGRPIMMDIDITAALNALTPYETPALAGVAGGHNKVKIEQATAALQAALTSKGITDPLMAGMTVSYDFSSQSFKFTQGINTLSLSKASTQAGNNDVMNLGPTVIQLNDTGLSGLKMLPNGNTPDRLPAEQRYGMKMTYDPVLKSFSLLSGSTGDKSSLEVKVNPNGLKLLGLSGAVVDKTSYATRGVASSPAVAMGTSPTVNVTTNFAVDNTNNAFVVTVDGIKGTVVIPPGADYSLESFMAKLQKGINALGSTDSAGQPTTVSGVKVTFDYTKNAFVFTTGTTGSDSFMKISGSTNWGLDQVEAGRGVTTGWIKPSQHKDVVGGALQPKYIDKDGKETTNGDGFVNLPAWSPIYLDKGELTFDTGGKLFSPVKGTQLETVYLEGGKGALTININYGASTQYTSPFAVLSQAQDGAPEGDLVGVTIGNDGLVSASFSNGTQKSLAKILLTTFSSPAGLRQVGDSSFLASAASGKPVLGTAGSAGFGTLRAGATERANVDLTQELVDLITAQRNFQANAKAIETSSTMTSAIINLRS